MWADTRKTIDCESVALDKRFVFTQDVSVINGKKWAPGTADPDCVKGNSPGRHALSLRTCPEASIWQITCGV